MKKLPDILYLSLLIDTGSMLFSKHAAGVYVFLFWT